MGKDNFENLTNKDLPQISFVIISRNNKINFLRCLESLITQDSINSEIIIFINTKDREFTEIIDNLRCSNEKINFKIFDNDGFDNDPQKRNIGLLNSSGRYIWHLYENCYLKNNSVSFELLNILSDQKTSAIKFEALIEGMENKQEIKDHSEKISAETFAAQDLLNISDNEFLSSFLFDRELAIKLNILDLEFDGLFQERVIPSQIINSFPCISYIKKSMYVKVITEEYNLNKKWNFFDFLSDRIYIYFNKELFGLSNKFNISFNYRKNFIKNYLLSKSTEDLPPKLSGFLNQIYSNDEKQLLDLKIDLNKSSLLNECNSNKELFDFIFNETEFVFHLGAHKTATTFVQNILKENKYDLALEGIIVIDLDLFREYSKLNRDCSNIKGFILFASLPLLFCKPKKVIISDENILIGLGSKRSGTNIKPYFYCGCSPSGWNIRRLTNILDNLERVKIHFAIRDYSEYIISRHSEASLFRGYKNLDNLVKDWDFDNSCSWLFVINNLKILISNYEKAELFISRFEDYKEDPVNYAEILCGEKVFIRELNDFDNREIRRNRATNEIIEFMEKYIKTNNNIDDIKRIYRKLLNFGYGKQVYKPKFLEKNFFKTDATSKKLNLSISYKEHCKKIELLDIKLENSKIDNHEQKNSFYKCAKLRDIKRNFKIYSENEINNDLLNNFIRREKYKNMENNEKYDFYRSNIGKSKGITAMLRVKNEEKNIKAVINSIVDLFEEIVLVDNGSTDNTLGIVKNIADTNDDIQKKLKIYNYPFNVSRCGLENFNTNKNSLKSLSYFYNFALSKCTYEYVMKWDGDMIVPKNMLNDIKQFIDQIVSSESAMIGIPVGITVFKGLDNKLYYQKNEFEAEVRIFKNINENYFEKDILWEKFHCGVRSRRIRSENPVYVEFKDLNQNEFSHWGNDNLGMSPRKRKEISDFELLHQLTKDIKELDLKEIEKYKFELYPYDLF